MIFFLLLNLSFSFFNSYIFASLSTVSQLFTHRNNSKVVLLNDSGSRRAPMRTDMLQLDDQLSSYFFLWIFNLWIEFSFVKCCRFNVIEKSSSKKLFVSTIGTCHLSHRLLSCLKFAKAFYCLMYEFYCRKSNKLNDYFLCCPINFY